MAVVNICKEHGKGVNEQEEIDAKIADAVSNYYEFVQKEIDIIAPEIVICCGTYPFIQKCYQVEDRVLPSGARYFIDGGKIYLEMPHPAIRISYQIMFAYFKEVLEKLERMT